jgi:hypothetical protein
MVNSDRPDAAAPGPGRDNSVSSRRNNLLTTAFDAAGNSICELSAGIKMLGNSTF